LPRLAPLARRAAPERRAADAPERSYQPTYPDDGSASFGIILAANGPFVEKAFISARALGRGANVTLLFHRQRGPAAYGA